jgi:penicillin-binding protein 1A
MGQGVTGSLGAIPVWVPTMMALHRSLRIEQFSVPSGIMRLRICDTSHKLATQFCPKYVEEYFIDGFPPDTCDVHGPQRGRKQGSVLKRFGTKKADRDDKARRKKLMF